MTDETVSRLRLAGKRRRSVEQKRSEASSALSDAVRAAKEAGMTPTTIAKEAGVSRQTVHDMLKGPDWVSREKKFREGKP